MKNIVYALLFGLAHSTCMEAQTIHVHVGNTRYLFPADPTNDMVFTQGKSLTILNKTFELTEVDSIVVKPEEIVNNLVNIYYNEHTAIVDVASNVAPYVDVRTQGMHVTITQTNTQEIDGAEITYALKGTSNNGSLTLNGDFKCKVQLAGVNLTNPQGAAICINNKKRIELSATHDTENYLSDGANGTHKGCVYSKGQLQIQGNGKLNVEGNTAHAIKSGDYITLKNAEVNIIKAVKDGISCNKYFEMESGKLTISQVGDDGIQCDFEADDTTTNETTNHENENSANIYIQGGTLDISVSAAGAKGIKALGNLQINDGILNVSTTENGVYDSSTYDAKGSSALKSDGNTSICGGNITLISSGSGGKCIKADGEFSCWGGTIEATTTGATYSYSSSRAQPKAIKCDEHMYIYGGKISAKSNSHEAIESKGSITISGGEVYAFSAKDDAINSANDMHLNGGNITGISNSNDGIDSNGNMYITGGTVIACGSGSPECGLDAAERYNLYITGGNVLAIGGGNNSVTSTTDSQCVLSTSGASTAGTEISIKSGSDTLASFSIPTEYSPSSSGMGGMGGGWRPGGNTSSSSSYLLSCPNLVSGTSYTVTIGTSSSSCRAATNYTGR